MRWAKTAAIMKVARKRAKATQNDVADVCGYKGAQFISNWERGISLPSDDAIVTLARAFSSYKVKEIVEAIAADRENETQQWKRDVMRRWKEAK